MKRIIKCCSSWSVTLLLLKEAVILKFKQAQQHLIKLKLHQFSLFIYAYMMVIDNKNNYFTEFMKQYNSKVHYFDYDSFNIWEYLKVEMFGIGKYE